MGEIGAAGALGAPRWIMQWRTPSLPQQLWRLGAGAAKQQELRQGQLADHAFQLHRTDDTERQGYVPASGVRAKLAIFRVSSSYARCVD